MRLHTLLPLVLLSTSVPVQAQNAYPATLAGHAILPALTFITAPKDAPASLQISGKYTSPTGRREDRPGAIAGHSYLSAKDAPRPTGISLPFQGQPVQGFSGIKTLKDGTYWVTADNGFGSKANSPDAMLAVHRIRPDWKAGKVQVLQTLFLHDPDRKVPFLIVNESTRKRYLTGADFDIESMQIVGEHFWFGDELGPYLIQTDRHGKVLSVHDTLLDGKLIRSPDHHSVTTPATPGAFSTPVRRSRGYEGMAASRNGQFLYPMLEGPLWDDASKQWENRDGREYLRILEFDVQRGAWTGRSWKYALELRGNNIGDFNMIDDDTALVIERDNGEGLERDACNGPARPDCQNVPARFKRVYKISLKEADAEGFVRKIGYVDLLDIQDPRSMARVGGEGGRFTFPLVTIENVDVVDGEHIIVANDNNLPFSSGRQMGRNDDNELILLHVPQLLSAR